jgi:acetylornithine/N-succinyldiaminopimelate aminotransferase
MDTREKTDTFVCRTYVRQGKAFVSGSGMYLTDEDGQVFTDFLAGIAVCSLGHCHPEVTAAIQDQAKNWCMCPTCFTPGPRQTWPRPWWKKALPTRSFFAIPGPRPMRRPSSWPGGIFNARERPERFRIITMTGSFHGRTMATLTATGQDKVKQGFYPPGARVFPCAVQ